MELPTELRHAYRALLRAATYLPDSLAREYVHNHVVHRFRSGKLVPAKLTAGSINATNDGSVRKFYRARIQAARKAARSLELAAQGDADNLKKVLLHTHGRTGKRRRELMNDLMRMDESSVPQDELALEELIKNPPVAGQQERFSNNPKFMAFLRSQFHNHPLDSSKGRIRKLKPTIPESNIWGRMTPLKRQKTIRRQFWASTLDRLLPPVPLHEFNRLRDLATGTLPCAGPPPRRTRPPGGPLSDDEQNTMVLQYFTTPPKFLRPDFLESVSFNNEKGVVYVADTGLRTNSEKKKDNGMATRSMKRLYGFIWSQTSTMSQDEMTKAWTITWGGQRSRAHSGEVTIPSAADEELFQAIPS